MFQHALDLQTWADLFEAFTDVRQSDLGGTMVTHARHPVIGNVVGIQDWTATMIVFADAPAGLAFEG